MALPCLQGVHRFACRAVDFNLRYVGLNHDPRRCANNIPVLIHEIEGCLHCDALEVIAVFFCAQLLSGDPERRQGVGVNLEGNRRITRTRATQLHFVNRLHTLDA